MTQTLCEQIRSFAPGTPGKVQLAVFDFDGTSIEGYSSTRLVRFLGLHGMLKMSTVVRLLFWGAAYKLRLPVSEAWVRRMVFQAFAGKTVDEVNAFFAKFYTDVIEPRFRPIAQKMMQAHREAGHVVVLCSASFKPLILAAMKAHPIDYQVSTLMRIDEQGRYTDEVEGIPTEGEQKPIAVAAMADKTFGAGNWELAFAYGDHHSDRFILESARHPFAVSPDRPLSRLAKEMQWPILDWSFKVKER